MLHRLAAVKLVRELELEAAALHFQGLPDVTKYEERLKKEIIQISCENGKLQSCCNFILNTTRT